MPDSEAEPLEELIDELRELADEAGERAEERKDDVDLSEVDPSHMALAENQGMRQAYQIAWNKAISKREVNDAE